MSQGTPNDHDKLAQELHKLWDRTQQHKTYRLRDGKWDKDEILQMLAAHKALLEKTIEAVEAGCNRGSAAENMLDSFGISLEYPNLF